MDGHDIQDDFNSLIDSLVSCESFEFEFRIAKIDQQADRHDASGLAFQE